MKLLKYFSGLLFIALLSFSCGSGSGESSDGEEVKGSSKIKASIAAISGRGSVIRSGSKTRLEQGMALQKGDRIQTMLGSKVDIQIVNRGVISLRNRATMVINKLEINKRIRVDLKQGKLLCALKKLEKGKSFSVATPTGVAGIRGTSFVMSTDSGSSKLAVLTGKVEIKNKNGQSSVIEEKKQTSFSDKKIETKTTIRGNSIADVKEILTIKGVEATGETEIMKKNIKALSILDKKTSGGSLDIDRDVKTQGLDSAQKDVSVKESEKTSTTKTIEDKTKQFGDDSEMMIK